MNIFYLALKSQIVWFCGVNGPAAANDLALNFLTIWPITYTLSHKRVGARVAKGDGL